MHPPAFLRPATLFDLPRLLDIAISALPQDPFYTYLWAFRDEFPNDLQGFWLQRLQADLYNPSYEVVVAELAGGVEGVGNPVVAFGIWERRGDDEEARERRRGKEVGRAPEAWNFHRSTLQDILTAQHSPRLRACPPARMVACASALETLTAHYDALFPSRFSLELLCTHPSHQRCGFGTAIVQWGLREAASEGVPVSVAASPGGEGLYRKVGFLRGREWVVGVEGEAEGVRFWTLVWGLEG